jgi:Protein of unknown function (DUF3606)
MAEVPENDGRVSFDTPEEVAYWTAKFKMTEAELIAIVAEKGTSVWAIESHLEMREDDEEA